MPTPSQAIPRPSPTAVHATVEPSASVVPVFTTWHRLSIPEPLPHVFGGSDVTAAVRFRGAYVAIGLVNGGCCDAAFSTDTHGVVWRSDDGLAWSLEPRTPAFDLARPVGLATDGQRLVAVGTTVTDDQGQAGQHGAVWVSSDGASWKLVPLDRIFVAIARSIHGFVAAADGAAGPELWTSADGVRWGIAAPSGALGPGSVRAMMSTSSGVVAVGLGSAPGDTAALAAAWQSSDGSRWTRAADQLWFSNASMDAIVASGTSIVAIGTDETLGSALWRSTDGLSWVRNLGAPFADSPASFWGIAASRRGYVLVGSIDGNVPSRIAWQSPDGLNWSQLDVPDAVSVEGLTSVEVDNGLVVFTRWFDGSLGRAIPQAWSIH